LSRIYLHAPNGHYYDLSYRDLRRPPISLWEHRLAVKRLSEQGHPNADEGAIFRTVETMRQIVDEAVSSSKAARRQRERRLHLIQGGLAESDPGRRDVVVEEEEQTSAEQPWERMLPFEEWS
jgi:putative transposase